MSDLESLFFSAEDKQRLRRAFSSLEEVTPFLKSLALAGQIASLGILREIGTVNDELARFIFDFRRQTVIERNSLKADLVRWKGFTGVRIWSEQSDRLELRARGLRDLLHPDFSYDENNNLYQLVIFPEIVARIAALEGIELVLVKSWGMNSIFGGFDPAKEYYQTNFWELENNDALVFSNLVRQGQLALLGTHDLIAHIAGLDAEKWPLLREQAQRVHEGISRYFKKTKRPSIASLILPYTVGVILDDLAQPPTYGSSGHALFLEILLEHLERQSVPADLPTVLTKFPKQFEKIIECSRREVIGDDAAARQSESAALVGQLVHEIQQASWLKHA
jgi:hypothetical protein